MMIGKASAGVLLENFVSLSGFHCSLGRASVTPLGLSSRKGWAVSNEN